MYQKSSILLATIGVWKINSVACGFSPSKIDYSDYLKSLSSIGAGLAFLTSLPVTSGPRWRPPRHQDGGPHEIKMAAPVTRSVTPRRVSQRPRPREGSVTS